MYLTGNLSDPVRPLLDAGRLGLMNTPKNAYRIADNWWWAADNGCFGKGYPGDVGWLAWLESFTPIQRSRCLFATAPDVVGDSASSLQRSLPWLATIRDLGYPVALVTQDGTTPADIPWSDIDWLFIGGTNAHKLGDEAKTLIAAATLQGKRVHVGRVNSQRRYEAMSALGCDSVDGTYLGFGPDQNLPRLLSWLDRNDNHIPLFSLNGAK